VAADGLFRIKTRKIKETKSHSISSCTNNYMLMELVQVSSSAMTCFNTRIKFLIKEKNYVNVWYKPYLGLTYMWVF